MKRKNRYIAGLTVLSITAGTEAAPRPMRGCEPVEVGFGVPGVKPTFRNLTGEPIFDLTFTLGPECGVNITTVTVTGSPNIGDWDVDDSAPAGLGSQGAGEKDDTDSSATTKTRTDSSGDGKNNAGAQEPNPQNTHGKSIKKKKDFRINVWFSAATNDECVLKIWPTRKDRTQIGTAPPAGMSIGPNDYNVDSEAFVPGLGGLSVISFSPRQFLLLRP